MKLEVEPGRYVLAVSGGVDSMTLLNLLSNLPDVELIVGHFDHGMRPDSGADEQFVRRTAARYGLPYETGHGKLGAQAGEAAARTARYGFLSSIKEKHGAKAIITAHHQDDLIETALINLLRGTGRRGLFSIKSNTAIIRPLLGFPKNKIIAYAMSQGINWREDPTNAQDDYLRNYIRHRLMPKLDNRQRRIIISNIDKVAKINRLIDALLDDIEPRIIQDDVIDRSRFAGLPAEIGDELLVRGFRRLGAIDIDKRTVSRINSGIRTARAGRRHPVKNGLNVELTTETASFRR